LTTIVLADDHCIVRQGLRALLAAEPGLRVVAEAADGLEALQIVERQRPQVLVLDLIMPSLNGIEVTRQVRQRSPETQVIILSMHSDEAYVLEALRAGAAGYVLKESPIDELLRAIDEVTQGRRYLAPPLSEWAIAAYVRNAEASGDDPLEALTCREREVIYLVAEGLSATEIAARLSISPRTVETHRANLMRKLGLRNQAEVIRFALEQGLVLGAR
jgi:two-component system response regulator NreC